MKRLVAESRFSGCLDYRLERCGTVVDEGYIVHVAHRLHDEAYFHYLSYRECLGGSPALVGAYEKFFAYRQLGDGVCLDIFHHLSGLRYDSAPCGTFGGAGDFQITLGVGDGCNDLTGQAVHAVGLKAFSVNIAVWRPRRPKRRPMCPSPAQSC